MANTSRSPSEDLTTSCHDGQPSGSNAHDGVAGIFGGSDFIQLRFRGANIHLAETVR